MSFFQFDRKLVPKNAPFFFFSKMRRIHKILPNLFFISSAFVLARVNVLGFGAFLTTNKTKFVKKIKVPHIRYIHLYLLRTIFSDILSFYGTSLHNYKCKKMVINTFKVLLSFSSHFRATRSRKSKLCMKEASEPVQKFLLSENYKRHL